MVPQQVEKTITEMIHREPFLPFAVELTGGQTLEILVLRHYWGIKVLPILSNPRHGGGIC